MEHKRENQINYLKDQFEKTGISLTKIQIDQFLMYYDLLIQKNKVMNLTTITEFEDVVQKHFIDSAIILTLPELDVFTRSDRFSSFHSERDLKETSALQIIDIGTGAGFPGIPLKILLPDVKVLLLDSLNKRVLFLKDVIQKLELHDISVLHARAEEAGRDPIYREQYDLCVSRAVSNLSSLSEYCLPFVKRGGYFVSYKSSSVDQECKDARKAVFLLGGTMSKVRKVTLPDSDIERSFVFIRKEKGTSLKYPRKAGIPAKNPL